MLGFIHLFFLVFGLIQLYFAFFGRLQSSKARRTQGAVLGSAFIVLSTVAIVPPGHSAYAISVSGSEGVVSSGIHFLENPFEARFLRQTSFCKDEFEFIAVELDSSAESIGLPKSATGRVRVVVLYNLAPSLELLRDDQKLRDLIEATISKARVKLGATYSNDLAVLEGRGMYRSTFFLSLKEQLSEHGIELLAADSYIGV